ncbi:tpr domain containing protein [Stylonychia lemnae]|uniref:Tpr domain containing protein n=1 Tax=Stylonychia lemnae TaxID=5949 RepID=A0A078B758_STYLE|nr:tpr domain containing protein [Stylonychia lemnae]|eukprot:CDW89383.1 tpr domain containing protein [Stylonychia lemnae]
MIEGKVTQPYKIGRKLLVTEEQLDNWFAKQYNLDITCIPAYKPPTLNKAVYDQLKKYAPHNQNEQSKNSVIAERLKKRQARVSIKDQQKGKKRKMSSMFRKGPTSTQINNSYNILPSDTLKILQEFQPIMYAETKKVNSFIDGLPQEDQEQYYQRMLRLKKRQQKDVLQEDLLLEKAKKKVELIKQDNFKTHVKPTIQVQNRMNSSINQIMSRGEIQQSAQKMQQLPANFKFLGSDKEFKSLLSVRQSNTQVMSPIQSKRNAQNNSMINNVNGVSQTPSSNRAQSAMNQNRKESKQTSIFQKNRIFNFQAQNAPIVTQRARSSMFGSNIDESIQQVSNNDRNLKESKNSNHHNASNSYFKNRHSQVSTKFNSDARLNSKSLFKIKKFSQELILSACNSPKNSVKNLQIKDFKISIPSHTTQNSPMIKQKQIYQDYDSNRKLVKQISNFTFDRQNSVASNNQTPFRFNIHPSNIDVSQPNFRMQSRQSFTNFSRQGTIGGQKRVSISLKEIENELKESESKDFEICNLKVRQIIPTGKLNNNHVFQDADYWHHRGIQLQHHEDVEVSIDYYLHGIRANPRHFGCIYNVACVYQQLDKHLNAIKWFRFASLMQQFTADPYFGCAISLFKLRRIHLKEEEIWYFKAMCYKKLQLYDKADLEYKKLDKHLKHVEGLSLVKLQSNLKKLYIKDQWIEQNFSARLLGTLNFFSRLPHETIQKYLPFLKLVEKKQNDLLFIEDSIIILLNGRVIIRNHPNSIKEHKILANYIEGAILGWDEGDRGLSKDCNNWAICASEFVQYIEMDKKTFKKLFKHSRNSEKETHLNVITSFPFFQIIFPQNIQMIAYDLGRIVNFQENEIVLFQHQRSVLNKIWKVEYNDHNQNKFQLEIERNLQQKPDDIKSQAPSVYQGFMRAISTKKTDNRKLTINENLVNANKLKKSILKGISKGLGLLLQQAASPEKQSISINQSLSMRIPSTMKESTLELNNDLISFQSYEYFGDIIAGKDGVECLVIDNPDDIISLYERQILNQFMKDKLDGIKHTLQVRYKLEPLALHKY